MVRLLIAFLGLASTAFAAETLARSFLAASYGVYSYDHLPRTTWAQARAQMNRLNGGGLREISLRAFSS